MCRLTSMLVIAVAFPLIVEGKVCNWSQRYEVGRFKWVLDAYSKHLCTEYRIGGVSGASKTEDNIVEPRTLKWTVPFTEHHGNTGAYTEPPTTSSETASSGQEMSTCPPNMVPGDCTCRGTCAQPYTPCSNTCVGATRCTCPDWFLITVWLECVSPTECPCFWKEIDRVIPEGESYVNADCTMMVTCTQQVLHVRFYTCSQYAECAVDEDDVVGHCHCKRGYQGDGLNCTAVVYLDCSDAYINGNTRNGTYTIRPPGWSGSPFNVSCRMDVSGNGGWMVIQRRMDGVTDFYRNWTSYRDGFGLLEADFWIGNEKLHNMTSQREYKLRIDFVTSDGEELYYEHSSFAVEDEENKYRLKVGGKTAGTAQGEGMAECNGKAFSTHDMDNDDCTLFNCAERHQGAWWYGNQWCDDDQPENCLYFEHREYHLTGLNVRSTSCTPVNFNGVYNGGNGKNIFYWYGSHCNLNYTEMKIRPLDAYP